MRQTLFLAVALTLGGCGATTGTLVSPRTDLLRDLEGYAIASCLVYQSDPYLQDQGDAWASVIVQRSQGDLEVFTNLATQVKNEVGKGEMAVIRDEAGAGKDKALPVLYCGEIIDKPAIRSAIEAGVGLISRSYQKR